jgi:hypothetical protein
MVDVIGAIVTSPKYSIMESLVNTSQRYIFGFYLVSDQVK